MLTVHMAKIDKNLRAFLKTKLLLLIDKKRTKDIMNLDYMKKKIDSKVNN